MTPDGARDESPAFRGINESTVGQIQRLASMCAEELRCGHGLHLAMFLRASRSHLAVRHVYDREGSPGIPQKQGDAAGAPFHIVRMRAKEENVDWHKQPWYL
jgi:hypothetical protein